MNAENFERYLKEKVIPNVPIGSVLIMDNAPSHSRFIERPPSASQRKAEIAEFVQAHEEISCGKSLEE